MQSGFFLDIIVGKSTAIFELLASEDQALLVRRNSLLILDLCLDVINGVRGLNLQSNGLASESLDD